MKNHNMKITVGVLALGITLSGCSNILEETDREGYTPGYFKTEAGVEAGVTALYANLRYYWGNGYWLIANETGTDEYTYGHGGNGNDLPIDMSGQGDLNASNCRADVLWNVAFTDINTASGVLENGSSAGISESLLSEARFFRALDYFELVQTFGGVPLDLGAGELKFNTNAVRISKRNTVPEVYTKAIFPDLITAIKNLPETGRVTGGVTKTAARLVLAKAYLTYGWWLQNPNSIPTYPECSRTDPDGHDATWYFQQAYDVALTAIQNPGNFSLQKSFYDVNEGSNDRNSEIVLYADHTQSSNYYDGGTNSDWSNGTSPGNFARWMCRWDYTFLESSKSATTWDKVRTVQREAVQGKDRPWKEMATPIEVSTRTFADKKYDSRYDGTFAYQFRGNWEKVDALKGIKTIYNANDLPITPEDSVLTFLDEDNPNVVYPVTGTKNVAGDGTSAAGYSNVGAGVLSGRADYVINPSGISRYAWLNNWKNGIYRTDNGSGLGKPNGDSPRPYPVLKFSELYFIAAEAAVRGATTQSGYSARDLINVIRARAGVWTYDNNRQRVKVADYSKEMMEATPQTITVDYILDERSRELFGEGYRWWDLVRTQTWATKAGTYTICGKQAGDHTPETVTRTITPQDYLRPIPQGQLDALQMTDEEKAAFQNPGYSN
ncbi:MAG: RagB/SusD family nutrient uptake outer membrane protein [Prevotella sp.]|nr:RagB/SusD family nutrient uptake outer membrane protein [Prevotella sp.]